MDFYYDSSVPHPGGTEGVEKKKKNVTVYFSIWNLVVQIFLKLCNVGETHFMDRTKERKEEPVT